MDLHCFFFFCFFCFFVCFFLFFFLFFVLLCLFVCCCFVFLFVCFLLLFFFVCCFFVLFFFFVTTLVAILHFDFCLSDIPYTEITDTFNFIDLSVHFRNSGVKGLMLIPTMLQLSEK